MNFLSITSCAKWFCSTKNWEIYCTAFALPRIQPQDKNGINCYRIHEKTFAKFSFSVSMYVPFAHIIVLYTIFYYIYMLDPYVKFPAFKTHIYNYYIWAKHVANKLYLKYFNSYLPQQNYPKHVFKSLFFTLKFLKQLLIFLLNTTKNKTTKNITH